MARVSYVNPTRYKLIRLKEFLEGRRIQLGKSQRELGEAIGLTQQAYSYLVKTKDAEFSYTQIMVLLNELGATDEEYLQLMKM